MSRNVKGSPPSAVNRTEQHDSNNTAVTIFDLSDEDGYSAVEDITDAEDNDEEDVDAVEEENIRTEAVSSPHSNPRPFYDQYFLPDGDQDDQQDDQHCYHHQTLADILDEAIRFQNYVPADTTRQSDDFDDGTSWAGIVSDNDINLNSDLYNEYSPYAPPDIPDERRVRFDVPSSESDSTDSDRDHHDLFPDIFISENVLDPGFRKEIEFDVDNESSGSATSWDCTAHQEERPNSEPEAILRRLSAMDTFTSTAQTADDADRDFLLSRIHSLDNYETDGDTTEEDTPEPPVRRRTRRPSVTASEVTDLESEPVKKQRGQPRLGRFKLDRSDKKPIAVLNTLTRKMMIFTPHRRHQLDLSPEQFNLSWSVEEQSSPLVRSSSNLGLDAMLSHGPFDSRLSDTQDTGLAESFVPAVQCSSDSIQDDNESEKKLDMSDFITFGEDGSPVGDENSNWQPFSTPLRPTTASSEIDVLSHLNSDTVGAFRRNQINQQLILSSQATPDSLAFSGPYNFMALKGLKSDRVETAAIPLTPARRLKHMKEMVRSPLEAASAKRKASDKLGSKHKRHRSISDVNLVQT